MKVSKELVVLDLETTGTWVEKDKIVEIGMIKLMPDGTMTHLVERVNPGIPIPPKVSEIINIKDEDVKDKPYFSDIAGKVVDFIGCADLGGFNIKRFDLPLLKRELFEAGFNFDWETRPVYDAQVIYHIKEKRDLTAAYRFYCEKDLEKAHTALGDVEATLEVLAKQVEKYGSGKDELSELGNIDYEKRSNYFDSEQKFCWWNKKLYPTFGKYARKVPVCKIAADDPEYLKWVLNADFKDDVKKMIEDVLSGRVPEYEDNDQVENSGESDTKKKENGFKSDLFG